MIKVSVNYCHKRRFRNSQKKPKT